MLFKSFICGFKLLYEKNICKVIKMTILLSWTQIGLVILYLLGGLFLMTNPEIKKYCISVMNFVLTCTCLYLQMTRAI